MVRLTIAIVLVGVLALSWLPMTNQAPSCCKAHHCTMQKHCGIGTASSPPAAKIYTVLCDVLSVTRIEIAFELVPLPSRRPPVAAVKIIDHPPRPLLV